MTVPEKIAYGSSFTVSTRLERGARIRGDVKFTLIATGIHTHGQGMGQRAVELGFKAVSNSCEVI